MEKDLISVVVPIYNVEKYLRKCIDSILGQTYKNIEILLIDDGSPDNCGSICDEYSKKYDNVFTYHKQNGGLSDARNFGLSKAKGKYICFIDSDDYVAPEYLICLYDDMKRYNVRISTIGFMKVNENCEYIKGLEYKSEIFEKEEALKQLFTEEKYCNFAWNKLFDIELFKTVKYPVGKKMEDLGTMYLLFDLCDKVTYNPTKLYYYVQRENSILHTKNNGLVDDKFELALQRYEYIKNKYPAMIENEKFIFELCLSVYPFFENDSINQKKCEKIIENLEANKIVSKMKLKIKIKYVLYSLNKKIYAKLLKK